MALGHATLCCVLTICSWGALVIRPVDAGLDEAEMLVAAPEVAAAVEVECHDVGPDDPDDESDDVKSADSVVPAAKIKIAGNSASAVQKPSTSELDTKVEDETTVDDETTIEEETTVDEPEATPSETQEETPVVAPPVYSGPERLTPELERLKAKVRRAISLYYPKKLNTRDNDAWEVMHSIIGYGVYSEVHRSSPHGNTINSVSWLCYNGACKGERMLFIDQGRVSARRGVGVQGHAGQFLAILAQSRVPADYPLMVDNRRFTITDLIETEKLGCQVGIELTFKLIALSHYLKDDDSWRSYTGDTWTIERLVEEEIKAPIRGAACGGTHRLMGLAYAVRRREIRDQSIEGQFGRAQKYLNDYHRYTFGLQNPDGSFSTEWFTGRGSRNDLERRLQTTGHILEWLSFSVSREQLDDPHVKRAVDYLASIMINNTEKEWEIGHLGHACHALAIYDQRRFRTPVQTSPLASGKSSPSAPTNKPRTR